MILIPAQNTDYNLMIDRTLKLTYEVSSDVRVDVLRSTHLMRFNLKFFYNSHRDSEYEVCGNSTRHQSKIGGAFRLLPKGSN